MKTITLCLCALYFVGCAGTVDARKAFDTTSAVLQAADGAVTVAENTYNWTSPVEIRALVDIKQALLSASEYVLVGYANIERNNDKKAVDAFACALEEVREVAKNLEVLGVPHSLLLVDALDAATDVLGDTQCSKR